MDALLTTPRLLLRPHHLSDVPFMVRLNDDPDVVRYTGDVAFEDPSEAVAVVRSLQRQFAARRMGRLIAIERATGEPVGWCGLKFREDEGVVDLGYRFLKDRWGRGYATEAGQACVRYGFDDLGLASMIAEVVPENKGSVRVLEKLGFRRIGPSPNQCNGFAADRYCLERASEPS
ncbi:MAG: GNAT family N-acetyltransferase [Myxococcota bacterium]